MHLNRLSDSWDKTQIGSTDRRTQRNTENDAYSNFYPYQILNIHNAKSSKYFETNGFCAYIMHNSNFNRIQNIQKIHSGLSHINDKLKLKKKHTQNYKVKLKTTKKIIIIIKLT